MGLDEIFVHIDPDSGTLERTHRSRVVDFEWQAAKPVPKQVFARHIRLEITSVLDGAKEMNGCRHIDAGR